MSLWRVGMAFTLSGEMPHPYTHALLRKMIADRSGKVLLKPDNADYLVIGKKASMLDLTVAHNRHVPIITCQQLTTWMTTGLAPEIMAPIEAMMHADDRAYEYIWGDKPDDFGAF